MYYNNIKNCVHVKVVFSTAKWYYVNMIETEIRLKMQEGVDMANTPYDDAGLSSIHRGARNWKGSGKSMHI